MNLDNVYVFDIETDGLLKTVSKLHCMGLGYKNSKGEWKVKSTTDPADVAKIISNPDNVLVCHNVIQYDKPVLEKLLGIKFEAQVIDTLGLSYILYFDRGRRHGLEAHGEDLGVAKPKIVDWENLSVVDYLHRVEEDVKINILLWDKMLDYLRAIYDNNDSEIIRYIHYINFKMDCLRIQEENPILIDIPQATKNLEFLQNIIDEKTTLLEAVMPKIPVYGIIKKPDPVKYYKKDGTMSEAAKKWEKKCMENNLPPDTEYSEIKYIRDYKDPNAGSSDQIKDWLFSLGWKPRIFKDGANGKVPQLRDDDKMLCESIIDLSEQVPELKHLQGLSVAQHRAAYLKAFLEMADENGYVSAWAHGFTKTLRLKHAKPFVNLPKPNTEHGSLVRSVMIAPPGYVFVGSDVSSLEDKMKQINIYPYDPDYVEDMNRPGWDAHLDIAERSNIMSKDEITFYKWFKGKERNLEDYPEAFRNMSDEEMHELFDKLVKNRQLSKQSNYMLTYGGGVAKLADLTKTTRIFAQSIYDGYWKRNWAVKKFADDQTVKNVKGTMWIFNPISKFWYPITAEKDRFNSINQSSGVRVFDGWLYHCIRGGYPFMATFHDEAIWCVREDKVEDCKRVLKEGMEKINKQFNFPVQIEIDIQSGKTYAEVH